MTEEVFKELCEKITEEMRRLAPKDTGNLAYNAIQMKMNSANECEISVSGNSIKSLNDGSYIKFGIAPYMPFTNEKWISPKWNGRKNPNEGWFEKAVQNACEMIAKKYEGVVKK